MDPRNRRTYSLDVGAGMSRIALTFSGSALSPCDEIIWPTYSLRSWRSCEKAENSMRRM